MPEPGSVVRVAAISDIHCGKNSRGQIRPLFEGIGQVADVAVIAGDLTDYGTAEEAHLLVEELAVVGEVPIVAVLGNHDYEAGEVAAVRQILTDAGVHLLDGDSVELKRVGFAGVKGFGGGFGRGTLGAWGEPAIKAFVQEAVDEALKLEAALVRLTTPGKVAVLHYAPIRATIASEPVEIHPFLGSGRLEEPLNRYPVFAAVHGHAHNGDHAAATSAGVPVYNVALPLMRKTFPDRPPFLILEVPAG